MSNSRKHRSWYETYHEKKKFYVKCDASHRILYQIDTEGNIVGQFESQNKVAQHFKTHQATICYAVKNQKMFKGFLFVPMLEYKSTTNYKLLIKLIQNKLVKLNS
jgi:hypothetical protein